MLSQVADDYYTLASPYPERLVAVISQQSQIVDSTGRSVPLSEVSCILLLIESATSAINAARKADGPFLLIPSCLL